MDKKKLIVLGLLVLILTAMCVLYVMHNGPQKTPEQVIRKAYNDSATSLQMQSVIKELDVKGGKLVLYRNANGNVVLAYLEANGKSWDIKATLGEQSLRSDVIPVGEFFSVDREENIYIGFGIIYDRAVTKVTLDGHETTMVDGDVRFWYYFSNTEFEQDVTVESLEQ